MLRRSVVVCGLFLLGCGSIVVPPEEQDTGQTQQDTTTTNDGTTDGTGGDDTADAGPDVVLSCSDDAACVNVDACTFGQCVGGKCEFTSAAKGCKVGGQCFKDGMVNPASACLVCDVSENDGGWSAVTCDDDNPCTKDSCDSSSGCKFTPDDDATCDVDPCATDDRCEDGTCVFTPCECKVDADCSNVPHGDCEKVVCNASTCVTTSDLGKNGQACSEGDLCLEGGTCSAGQCVGEPKDCSTAGTGPCKPGVCDAATGACVAADAPEGTSCSDGDACTVGDTCKSGACSGAPLDCSAFEGDCVTAACVGGACQTTPVEDGTACEAANACIVDEQCLSGACLGSWDVESPACACDSNADCDDKLPCTQDSCDVGTGACSNVVFGGVCLIGGKCWFDGATSDVNPCQICDPDASQTAWSQVGCDDGNPCTDDYCDPAAGCSAVDDDTNACSDGDPCTKDDNCQDGACTGYCECKIDAHCVDFFEEVPACQKAACIGFKCVVVADAAANGATCEDGDLCTVGDFCAEGACEPGEPIVCEGATSAGCATTGCNPDNGTCETTLATAGTPCNDGDPCTTTDQCNAEGLCGGQAKDCTTGFADQCNDGACEAGTCVKVPKDGAACDDGEECTPDDTCSPSGVCQGTWDAGIEGCVCLTDADCDDGLDCTLDSCAPSGECVSTPKPGFCVIGKQCYANNATAPANKCLVCKSATSTTTWQSVKCDDGNQCTDDLCDPALGCLATDDDTNACNDGDPCTKDDNCKAGECVGTCECTVDADCAGNGPVAACRKWACSNYECVEVPDTSKDGTACEDGLYCTDGDKCSAGTCSGGPPRNCAAAGDGVCTTGVCDDSVDKCVAQTKPNGTACADGNACTLDDQCTGGVCKGKALDCSSLSNQCNDGLCVSGACQAKPKTGASCSDGQDCTVGDACTPAGQCVGTWDAGLAGCGCGSDADCADQYEGDPCNVGRCDTGTNECYAEAQQGEVCDDKNACTKDDQCGGTGLCGGTAYSCDDKLACTDDACDGKGGCSNTLKSDRCLIEGVCYNLGQTNPANPCQICSGGTSWAANTGVVCNDDNACTKADTCKANGTCSGTAYTCSFLPQCQTAQCDGNGGCNVTTLAGWCTIGGACVASGTQNPGNQCQTCDPAKSKTAWSNRTGSCNDGNACTKDDLCSAGTCGGTAYTCNDGLTCTTDSCNVADDGCSASINTGTCLIDGVCYANGGTKPGNPCLVCDAAKTKTAWTAVTKGTACNDGLACTTGDACDGAGQCLGSLEGCSALECEKPICNASGGCDVELKAGWCRIGGACYLDGATAPGNTCLQCAAKDKPEAWTPLNGAACNDGEDCTANDQCEAGECVGKDYAAECNDELACTTDLCDGLGGCKNKLDGDSCLIGGVCFKAGEKNPKNECQSCNPAVSTSAWTNLSDGTACGSDGLSCTLDQCTKGQCTHALDPDSKSCLIGGECFTNGEKNPKNDCQGCNVKGSTTAWSNLSKGAACGDDGNTCTSDTCDGAGTCLHDDLANWSSCDDGKSGTTGDWCYGGVCSGFTMVIQNGDSNVNDQDRYIRATSSGSGVHVIHRTGLTGEFASLTARLLTGTGAPASKLSLGNPSSPEEPALNGNWLIKYGNTFYEFLTDTLAWSNKQESGSIRAAWASVSTNPNTTWRGIASIFNFLSGTTAYGAGYYSAGNALAVRRCHLPFNVICIPGQPCSSPSWSCADMTVSLGTNEKPVEVAVLSSKPYIGSNYSTSYIDIHGLDPNDSTKMTRVEDLPTNSGAYVLRAFKNAGSVILAAGDNGFLATFDGTTFANLDISSVFGSAASTSWTDILVFEGNVWVLGSYTSTSGVPPIQFSWKNFVLAYASTSADLKAASSWKVHNVTSFGGAFVFGSCSNASHVQMNALGQYSGRLYLMGSWCTTAATSSNNQQDAAFWYWTKP